MPLIETREEEDVLVIRFKDAKILDETTIEEIGKELGHSISQAPAQKIVLDFAGVSFMSSAMIGKLVDFSNRCKAADTKLKLSGISDNVMEVFKIMRLNKVFDIHKSEDKAIASFEKRGWFG